MRTFAHTPKTPQQPAHAKCGTTGRSHVGQSRDLNAEEFAAGSTTTPSTGFGHNFSRIPVHAPAAGSIQTKLAINRPGDAYEQEADRTAAQVMSLSSPEFTPVRISTASGANTQRKCASCEEEEETVHRKEAGLGPGIAPPIVHEVLGSSGQPLDAATRAFMEPRFGQDFGRVRVHTDERAASSARAIDALAYTAGENIVFGCGQHRPDTWNGRHLLAHELAHVVQQAQQPARAIYRQATKQDEADKLVAVKDHKEQQQRVVQFLANALKIKPDPAKGPLDPDNLYHNTAQLVDPPRTAKAVLKVLTPTHYSDPNKMLVFFDNRVAHPNIGGDYPADPHAMDTGVVLQAPGGGVLGQTDVVPSQSTGTSTTTTPKVERAPGRVDPTYTGKEPAPKSEATETGTSKTPAKPTPPVIAWSAAEIKLFLGRSAASEAEVKSVLVHEGQHVADWIYLKGRNSGNWQQMFELYKSEFTAFWIQPVGTFTLPAPNPIGKSVAQASIGIGGGKGCDVCGGPATSATGTASKPPMQPIGMKNERQEKIFFNLLSSYPNDHFDCLYVCNKDFRDAVDAYDSPKGINLANSARLIDLSIELQKLTPASTRAEAGQTNLQTALEHLDALDWTFLKDRKLSAPFWDSAKGFAPTSIYEALDALAKKSKPTDKEISKALEKALAKLKAS